MQTKVLENIALKRSVDQIYSLDSLLESELTYYMNEVSASHSQLLQSYNAENLHQMRVTLRRMVSLLHFFENELPQQEWKTARDLIKTLLKPTSKIRDFDVVNANYIVPAYRKNDGSFEFRGLLNQSHGKLLALHRQLTDELASFPYLRALKELKSWVQNHKWRSVSPDYQKIEGKAFRKQIEKKLNQRARKLAKNIAAAKKYDRKKLHRLRMDVKELRYMLDIFRMSIKRRKRQMKFLAKLQELLGDINDSYIAEGLIDEFESVPQLKQCKKYIHKKSKQRRANMLRKLQRNF